MSRKFYITNPQKTAGLGFERMNLNSFVWAGNDFFRFKQSWILLWTKCMSFCFSVQRRSSGLQIIAYNYSRLMDNLPMKISGQKDYKAIENCFD